MDLEQIAAAAQKQSEPYKQFDAINKLLNYDARAIARTLWELTRRELLDTTADPSFWEPMGADPGAFTAEELLAFLERLQDSPRTEALALDAATNWSGAEALARFVAARGADARALVERVPALREPLRSGLAFALAAAGHLPASALEPGVLARAAAGLVQRGAVSSLAGIERVWPEDVLGPAVIEGAAAATTVNLSVLRQYQRFARPAQLVNALVIAVNGPHAFPDGLAILDGLGEAALPALQAAADRELAAGIPEPSRLMIAGAGYARALARHGQTLAPPYDALLVRGVQATPYATHGQLYREAFAALPLERREAVWLKQYSVFWEVLGVCATPATLAKALETVRSWGRGSRYGEELRAQKALASCGETAVPALREALAGANFGQRDVVVLALAEIAPPSAAAELVAELGNAKEATRQALIDAVARVGETAALGPIEKALAARKAGVRAGAAAALAALPPSEATQRVAKAFAGKEKDEATAKLLAQVAAAAPGSKVEDPLAPLDRVRGALSEARRAELFAAFKDYRSAFWTERFDKSPAHAQLRRGWDVTAPPWTDPEWIRRREEDLPYLVVAFDALRADVAVQAFTFDRSLWARLLLYFRDLDVAAWAAMAAYRAIPTTARTYDLNSMLELIEAPLGARLIAPLVATLAGDLATSRKHLYAWLAARGDAVGPEVFARGLESSEAGAREVCVEWLTKAGASATDAVLARLAGGAPTTRAAAAAVLRAAPTRAAVPALEKALAAEKTAKVRPALEAALGACRLAGAMGAEGGASSGEAPSDEALDVLLAAQSGGAVPALVDLETLPAVRWRGGAALSKGAQRWLVARATGEGPHARDAQLAQVRARLTDEDCHALCDALRAQYNARPARADQQWVLFQQSVLGGDARMDELGAALGDWVSTGSAQLAFQALEVLRRNGAPAAVRWLDHWARKGRSAGLREHAEEALAGLEKDTGLTRQQLLDRAVPTLGFDARRERRFRFGPLAFVARLDAQDALALSDADGRALASLAKAKGAADDAGALDAAKKALAALRKELTDALARIARKFEEAMSAGQRWPAAEWRALFLAHPLARGMGHRLVFQALDASGAPGALFRVAEDDAPVDHAGAAVALPEGALVRLAHPAELSEDARARWKAALEAAGVTAPFPQLDRAVVVPADVAEPFGALLTTPVPARSLARLLDALNYRAGDVIDGGSVVDATRSLGPGASIRLSHSGFAVQRSGIGADEQCTIERVELEVGGRPVHASEAPRGLLNEALLDLRKIVAAADG